MMKGKAFLAAVLLILAGSAQAATIRIIDAAAPSSRVDQCATAYRIDQAVLRELSPLYNKVAGDPPTNQALLAALNAPVCASDLATDCTFGQLCTDGSPCVPRRFETWTVWDDSGNDCFLGNDQAALDFVEKSCQVLVDLQGIPLGVCEADTTLRCQTNGNCPGGECIGGFDRVSFYRPGINAGLDALCGDGTQIQVRRCDATGQANRMGDVDRFVVIWIANTFEILAKRGPRWIRPRVGQDQVCHAGQLISPSSIPAFAQHMAHGDPLNECP